MARTKRYTAAQVAEALENCGGVILAAANNLGCSARTVYNYLDRYVTCREALDKARKDLVGNAQAQLVRLSRDADHKDHYKAIKDILVKYDKETDWRDDSKHEVTGPDGGPLEFKAVNFGDAEPEEGGEAEE